MTSTPATDLPIENVVDEIRSALASAHRAVLVAEPGAGKSTVAPLRLLEQSWLGNQKILLLEPRRVAARSVARRMSSLVGQSVGATIGYQTRDERKIGPDTKIEVITEGILTRRLQRNPELDGVGLVIFDEFHERSVHADLGLAFVLDVMDTVRPDLRLLVMSATIDADVVAKLIGTETPAPAVRCAGRTHPVKVQWKPRPERAPLEPAVAAAVDQAMNEDGDVLIFLPGIAEIRRVIDKLTSAQLNADIFPLYGGLSAADQDIALAYNPRRRRIIAATDVAETSLTVEGIGAVIDTGLARRPKFDPQTGLTKLVTVSNSKASADQRAGRAGRLGPGLAIRLWSKVEHASRPRYEQPEILATDIASVVLEAAAWGTTDLANLRLLDQPKPSTVDRAVQVLQMLGAVDADGQISSDGQSMLRLPLPPRLAAMVHRCGGGPLGYTACVLATLLAERDVFRGRPAERPADLWSRVELVTNSDHTQRDIVDRRAVRNAKRRMSELARRVNVNSTVIEPDHVGRTLVWAYPDRLGQNRGGRGGRFRLRSGFGVEVAQHDPLALEPMIVAAEVTGSKKNPKVLRGAGIDSLDVELSFGGEIVERRFFGWDERRNDISQRLERRLGVLDFGTVDEPVRPSPDVVEVLLDRLKATNLADVAIASKTSMLQDRVALIRRYRPDDLPDVSVARLTADVRRVFAPWLQSAVGRVDLEKLDMDSIIRSEFDYQQLKLLDRLAPERYDLRSGRSVQIDYSGDHPTVAVRVQALFGLTASPMLVDGAVPLVFELLSPAQRPIQTTADLAGFWSGSWHDVRKAMKGRYPKHSWPENPSAT